MEDEALKWVPIAIATLNRCEHFARLIESIKKNEEAIHTDIYISVDYPPNEQYEEGYKKILAYLDKIDGFNKVHIYKQKNNFGPYKNSLFISEQALKEHDRVLFLEDDNELSMNAIYYYSRYLERYENDNTVIGVCGSNVISAYGNKMLSVKDFYVGNDAIKIPFETYGFATWKKTWFDIRNKCMDGTVERWGTDRKMMKKLRQLSPFHFCAYISNVFVNKTDLVYSDGTIVPTDMIMTIYMLICEKNVIVPVESKIRNWGWDGSGVHVGKDNVMKNPLIVRLDDTAKISTDIGSEYDADEIIDNMRSGPLKVSYRHVISAYIKWRLVRRYKLIHDKRDN